MAEESARGRFWWIVARAALLIGFLAGVGLWAYLKGFDINALLQKVPKERALAVGLWIFALFTFVTIVPIMVRDILRIYGALSLGLLWSTFWVWLAEVAAAVIAFLMARYLGRDMVEFLAGRRMRSLNRYLERAGFKTIFYLRLIPLTPYRPLNFAAGLTRMSFASYFFGTLLGALPHVFLYQLIYSSLGGFFRREGSGAVIWVNILVAVLTGGVILTVSLIARKKARSNALSSKE